MFAAFNPAAHVFEHGNAWACAKLAQLAYAPPDEIAANLTRADCYLERFWDRDETQGFMARKDNQVFLVFRGTEPDKLEDWATDLKVRKTAGPFGSEVHRGFMGALTSVWAPKADSLPLALFDLLSKMVKPKLWITGHSLGAALATLATARCLEAAIPVQALYTFGSPRVGNSRFTEALTKSMGGRIFRVVNNNDLVTRVPPRSFDYDHAGQLWYLSEQGALTKDPTEWTQWLDRALGVICDLGTVGIDGIKDHSMESGMDGYVPALRKHLPKF